MPVEGGTNKLSHNSGNKATCAAQNPGGIRTQLHRIVSLKFRTFITVFLFFPFGFVACLSYTINGFQVF
jgi:hypothetical protein